MMIEVYASRCGSIVRVQAWIGDIAGNKEPSLCGSFQISAGRAEKLIAQLRAAIDELPREVIAADLGVETL